MRLIRKLHLYTGLGLLSFVVMYFFTGYVLVHESIFPRTDPVKMTWVERFDYQASEDVESLAKYLQSRFALRGQRGQIRAMKDGRVRIAYFRPGYNFEVLVSADKTRAEITQTESGFRTLMVGYHRIHGYGGSGLYDLWSLMYDVASASCILFAITGIVIWYTTRRRDRLGWLFLGIGFGLTAAMVLYLMYTP